MSRVPNRSVARLVAEAPHDSTIHSQKAREAQQQRRSSGSGVAGDRQHLATLDLQVNAAENRVRRQA
jgi:hypothetical protein